MSTEEKTETPTTIPATLKKVQAALDKLPDNVSRIRVVRAVAILLGVEIADSK